jgi:predicted  nucleic acid-binding Zn ribbon protein
VILSDKKRKKANLRWILIESVDKIFYVWVTLELWYLTLDIRTLQVQIIAQCPECGNNWLLDDGAADKRIRCRRCRRLFKIPKLDDVPKAIKVIRHAKGTIYVDEAGKTYG